MTSCNVCESFTGDDVVCGWCGHDLSGRPAAAADLPAGVGRLPSAPPPGSNAAAVSFRPLAEAVAPVLSARRGEIAAGLEWALARGVPCRRELLAICFEVLDRHRGPEGDALTRIGANSVLAGGIGNWAALEGAMRPFDTAAELWVALHLLSNEGALAPGSDPLPALLEPLQCYGGLGADGRPRPDGVDVDFPCQCFVAHDPDCPEGMAQHIVGHHRDTFAPFVVHAHVLPRSADPPVSAFEPLFRLARRHRASGGVFQPAVEEFCHIGRIPASKLHDELWMYQLLPVMRRGFDPLVVDEYGHAVAPKADRRRRLGFRWTAMDDASVMHRCGVAARTMETDQRERERREAEFGFDPDLDRDAGDGFGGSGLRAL